MKRRLPIIAACAIATIANAPGTLANDIEQRVAADRMKLVRADCSADFKAIWEKSAQKAISRCNLLEESIKDYEAQKKELLEQRTWDEIEILGQRISLGKGFGPIASSEAASAMTAFFNGISVGAKIFNDVVIKLVPEADLADEAIAVGNVQEILKHGETIHEIVEAKSASKILYELGKYFSPLGEKTKVVITVAEAFVKNHVDQNAYREYVAELRQAVDRLDRSMDKARTEMARTRQDVFEMTRQGFVQFCAENNPPVAASDTAQAPNDDTREIEIRVLANDSDPDGDALRIAGVNEGSNSRGTARIGVSGTPTNPSDDVVVYRPPSGFIGEDRVTYTLRDDRGLSSKGMILIRVEYENAKQKNDATDEMNKDLDKLLTDQLNASDSKWSAASSASLSGVNASLANMLQQNRAQGRTTDWAQLKAYADQLAALSRTQSTRTRKPQAQASQPQANTWFEHGAGSQKPPQGTTQTRQAEDCPGDAIDGGHKCH